MAADLSKGSTLLEALEKRVSLRTTTQTKVEQRNKVIPTRGHCVHKAREHSTGTLAIGQGGEHVSRQTWSKPNLRGEDGEVVVPETNRQIDLATTGGKATFAHHPQRSTFFASGVAAISYMKL